MQSLPAKIFSWITHNKLTVALLAVVVFLLLRNHPIPYPTSSMNYDSEGVGMVANSAPMPMMAKTMALPMTGGGGPVQDSYTPSDRMITTDTNLSMKVTNVKTTMDQITSLAFQNGGFMVNSNMSTPEGGSSGTISIKVQAEKLSATLDSIRGLGVKVVSEYVNGTDVTDQYTDIEERLRIATTTKAKMEEILHSATKVSDMLETEREIMNLQSEIDSLKGQQRYLDKTTKLATISVYLSTDELALPYAPSTSWRPQQVFKEAIRSMMQTARGLANLGIWISVYAPIWIPAIAIYWFWKKRQKHA